MVKEPRVTVPELQSSLAFCHQWALFLLAFTFQEASQLFQASVDFVVWISEALNSNQTAFVSLAS